MSKFAGFSKDFFGFFTDLSKNNNREWFAENKDRYRATVVDPICGFIEEMAPRLAKISRHYVADPRPNGGSMFRIYRDVRFSKDKRPYKEHGACQFRHEAGKDAHAPGFYVHMAPDEVVFGGGTWKPPRPELERIRKAIADNHGGWRKVVEDRALVDCFGAVKGSGLKRPPRGFEPEHPYIEDIKRESFFAMHHTDAAEAMRPDFADRVEHAFRSSTPLMRFLTKALDTPF